MAGLNRGRWPGIIEPKRRSEQTARWKCNLLFYSSGYPDTPKDRASLGATIAEAFSLESPEIGTSFLSEILGG